MSDLVSANKFSLCDLRLCEITQRQLLQRSTIAGLSNLRNAFDFRTIKEAFEVLFSIRVGGVDIKGKLLGTNGVRTSRPDPSLALHGLQKDATVVGSRARCGGS